MEEALVYLVVDPLSENKVSKTVSNNEMCRGKNNEIILVRFIKVGIKIMDYKSWK